ncbi:MAG: DUF11 domain-containing protein [Thermomicrobiales bacterium]
MVENTATVDASNLEPYVDLVDEVSEPLSSTDSILVLCPDLEIEKVADQDSVNAGDKISFTITVTNNGPGAAYDVVMTDVLPANIDWDAVSDDACSVTDGADLRMGRDRLRCLGSREYQRHHGPGGLRNGRKCGHR